MYIHSFVESICANLPRGKQSFDQSGLGTAKPAEVDKSDNEFDLYRKRMMLAYRFRPNPLVSPCHQNTLIVCVRVCVCVALLCVFHLFFLE